MPNPGNAEAFGQPSIQVRAADAHDVSLILSFIEQKAAFDRNIGAFSGRLQVSEDKIHKTLFGVRPFAYVLFAEIVDREIGFALYGFRYSSFAGQPSIWLDDLFVNDVYRSQGVGAILMEHLAEVAQLNDCTHLAWTADYRNQRGLSFYRRLGAEITAQHGPQCFLKWVPQSLR